jgi:hypothetical protein
MESLWATGHVCIYYLRKMRPTMQTTSSFQILSFLTSRVACSLCWSLRFELMCQDFLHEKLLRPHSSEQLPLLLCHNASRVHSCSPYRNAFKPISNALTGQLKEASFRVTSLHVMGQMICKKYPFCSNSAVFRYGYCGVSRSQRRPEESATTEMSSKPGVFHCSLSLTQLRPAVSVMNLVSDEPGV